MKPDLKTATELLKRCQEIVGPNIGYESLLYRDVSNFIKDVERKPGARKRAGFEWEFPDWEDK